MSDELDQEDLSALSVLEDLAYLSGQEDTAPVEPPPADEAAEVLRRLYLESLGLFAYELQPAHPQPGTRATLLAHLIGDETQEVTPLMMSSAGPAPARSGAAGSQAPGKAAAPASPASVAQDSHRGPIFDPATGAPAAVRKTDGSSAGSRENASRHSGSRSRWPALLAAILALCVVGLGVWVAMVMSEVAYRDTQIRGLTSRVSELGSLASELESVKTELDGLEQRHAFVTATATTVYTLLPPAAGSTQPMARGHLFVAPDRRHWQLEVQGLKTEPEPQDYQLWFIVDGLPRSGGVFDAKPGLPALLSDSSMPTGTSAIAITLERKGGTASPTSPILLTADSSVQI